MKTSMSWGWRSMILDMKHSHPTIMVKLLMDLVEENARLSPQSYGVRSRQR